MKKLFLIILLYSILFTNYNYAQGWVSDTFDMPSVQYSSVWSPNGPISTSNTGWFQTFITIKKTELQAKGIVPGMTIFGVAFNKTNSNYILPGSNATLGIESRSGSSDSSTAQSMIYSYSLISNVNSYLAYISTLYPTNNLFINGFNMPNTMNIGWIPFMFNKSLNYTGGTLQFHTVMNMDSNAITGKLEFGFQGLVYNYSTPPNYQYNIPMNFQWSNLGGTQQNSNGSYNSGRPQMIIYHTPVNQIMQCNNAPIGGIVKGTPKICWPQFFLFLDNSSSGPGISYQWQYSSNNSNWTNIVGATGSCLYNNFAWNGWSTSSLSTPTYFRCNVTCLNSGITTPSDTFLFTPYHLNIDSINVLVTGNIANFNAIFNDTTFSISKNWTLEACNNCPPFYQFAVPPNGTSSLSSPQHQYSIDGTYPISLIVAAGGATGCGGFDTLISNVTIGCLGSPNFNAVIYSTNHNICHGEQSLLKLQDTLPADYITQWQYIDSNGVWSNLPNGNADSIWVSPTSTTVYRNVSTCTISGNKKISNSDYVQLPPIINFPITYTQIGNNCYFNYPINTPTVNFTWYFGNGDSVNNIINPTYHYNLAGNYQVMLVYENSGCLDTVYSNVSITTNVEEINDKILSVFPNPSRDQITLRIKAYSGKRVIVSIIDSENRLLNTIPILSTETILDLSDMAAGLYKLQYEDGENCVTLKLVKE